MRLFDDPHAPNCRRVRMFLAEKGIDVPREPVSIADGGQRSEAYLRRNPLGLLPCLELDDGRVLCESIAICRYFEELHPTPALFGTGAWQRAQVEQWQRHMELELLVPISQVFRNTHAFWKGRIEQAPDFGEICRRQAAQRLGWLDGVLSERPYVAGDTMSVADITALVAIDFGRVSKIRVAEEQRHLKRWLDDMRARPSASA